MNVEWVITGIILLSAMTAGGVSLYLKKRNTDSLGNTQPDSVEP
jgi:hypothetical protein